MSACHKKIISSLFGLEKYSGYTDETKIAIIKVLFPEYRELTLRFILESLE